MAARTRLVLDHGGIADLLRSPGVVADLADRAQRMADAAQSAAGEYPYVVAKSDDTQPRARSAVVVLGARGTSARSSATTLLLSCLDSAR